jgi:uncharacterized repeat protein (TIGR01451 family)
MTAETVTRGNPVAPTQPRQFRQETHMKKYSLGLILSLSIILLPFIASSGSLLRMFNSPMVTRAEIPGQDGVMVVSSPETVLNRYATLAADAPVGSSRLVLNYPDSPYGLRPDSLKAGDLLLVIQMAGATIEMADGPNYGQVTSLNNAGRYEFITVGRVEQGEVTVKPPCGGLLYSYQTGGSVQVIKVPQYRSLRIESGASVKAPAWNGAWGGIVAIHVEKEAVIDGHIDVSGNGFRGGALSGAGGGLFRTDYVTRQQDYGAEKGEGIAGYQYTYDIKSGRYGRGAAANGGGGGTSHNSGGGGGANGHNGATWTGNGVMDGTATGATAWRLDPAWIADGNRLTSSAGGGRGGYSFADKNQDALNFGPDAGEWGGDRRRNVGGLGGRPLAHDPAGRMYMGGGGGAGAQNNNSGGVGGNAGGLIYLVADEVNGQGWLRANGQPGGDTRGQNRDGAGGGGAGGTIVVYARSLGGIQAEARGGKGGDQLGTLFPNEAESQGPGGGGGGGYIAVKGGVISANVAGGANGISRAAAMVEFPANGATQGADGAVIMEIDQIPFCHTTADVTVTKTNHQDFIIPGLPTSYTIEVGNRGPYNIYGVEVADRLPAGFLAGSKSWTCTATPGSACSEVAGSGDLLTSVDVRNGGRVTLTVTAVMDPAATGSVTNLVEVIPPAGSVDPVRENNTASDTDRLTPVADLGIELTSGGQELVPGLGVSYQMTVRNLGPSEARGFNILDLVPETVRVTGAGCMVNGMGSCGDNLTNGNRVEFGNASLPVGAGNSLVIQLTGEISPAANGRLINTASVIIPAGAGFSDPELSSNVAVDNAPLTPRANLVITKTNHREVVVAGSSVTYEIEITNLGPSDAVGFDIMDEIPASMSMASLSCTATGGNCGTQNTTGQQIEVTGASLPAGVGHAIRMTFSGPVRTSATGRLVSVASVQLPVGSNIVDPEPESNIASDNDPLVAEADLAIRKTVASSTVQAGGQIIYWIEVSNQGPSAVEGARVTDLLPSGLSEAGWACQPVAGATCRTASGSGDLAGVVDLEVDGRALFTLAAKISTNFGGPLSNTATVSAPGGTSDTVPGNNSSTVTTEVGRSTDLRMVKSSSVAMVKAGDQLSYTLTVTNLGISEASGVEVTDLLPNGLELISITPSKGSCSGTTSRIDCQIGTLGVGIADNSATVAIGVRVPIGYPVGTMTNVATVRSVTPDPDLSNNSSSRSVTVNPPPSADFNLIEVTNNNPSLCLGSDKLVTVAIVIQNEGDGFQRDNLGPEFIAQFPVELVGVIGTCSSSTGNCRMSSNQLEWDGQLAPGQRLSISYQVRVRSGLPSGVRFCTRYRMNYDGNGDGVNDNFITRDDCQMTNCREQVACTGPNCAGNGPGILMANSNDPVSSDQRPGSILIFPYYTSSAVSSSTHNTRISITNTEINRSVYLHLFFIDGTDGVVADSFICLTANQTTSFLMSDMDPDVNGYLIAVAVNENGCPTRMNVLVGEAAIRSAGGYAAIVPAEGVAALAQPTCVAASILTTIHLDGVQYSMLGRTLAVDSLPSPANGDSSMLVVNGIGGNLTDGAPQIGKVNGLIFNDVEQGFSFTTTEGVQMAQVLTSTFPRSTPRLPTIVPAGRTGWMKLSTQNSGLALVGLQMSRNLNPGSFGGGTNLHKLTVSPTSLTIPVITPTCQ